MNCKRCDSPDVVKSGFVLRSGGSKQRYQCKECGYVFVDKEPVTVNVRECNKCGYILTTNHSTNCPKCNNDIFNKRTVVTNE